MADTILTKLADLIDPEVMADMISAKIPDKIRVAPFAKVDDTLAGVPGDTITVPSYGYIGDAEDVAEGVDVDIDKMSTKDKKYKIKNVYCYNEADFIDYLNEYVFPEKKSVFVKNLGWTDFGRNLPVEYKDHPYFNF